jgi:tight adherence protein B
MTPAALLWLGAGLLTAGLALAGWLLLDAAASRSRQAGPLADRLSIYTLATVSPGSAAPAVAEPSASPRRGLAGSAVALTDKMVHGTRLETALASRLDQAALPLEPAEWLLLHAGAALALAVVLGLLGQARPTAILLGLALGAAAPLSLLRIRADRRKAAFDGQLADSLQLLAGSLRAGYSVPQAVDAIVREGEEPMSTELGRALVEARLGLPLEDALESVARRMGSVDFSWVVMTLRIQRDVGGNLAEVLSNVAATMRERERLRRQVRVLSAEGRLSAWILGLLPLVFGGYLLLVRPQYLQPLWTTTLGWLMLVSAAVLFAAGVVWLRRVVKVTV